MKPISGNELTVLLTELKADMATYLKSSPAPIQMRTLKNLIAFDQAHERQEMALFGQELFDKAEKTKGLGDPKYKKARAISFAAAGPNGIDKLLKTYRVVALVGPTVSPAWKIDAANGDVSPGGGDSTSIAAVAGYPHLTVPMGLVKGLPVGLSFIGSKWSEARLLSLGYAYEQARGPFPRPKFYRSVEESSEVAPSLQPQR
jgi:amidase